MIPNISTLDKILRRSIGLMIIGAGFYYQSWYGLTGLIPIGLSYWNYCPLYMPFKINTQKKSQDVRTH